MNHIETFSSYSTVNTLQLGYKTLSVNIYITAFLFSEIRMKYIHVMCVQNVKFFSVKHGGKYSNHWALQRDKPNVQIKI